MNDDLARRLRNLRDARDADDIDEAAYQRAIVNLRAQYGDNAVDALLPATIKAQPRSHTQHVNAPTDIAVAGDVHGGITYTQQSGGVNFGSGNTITHHGDVVDGDKVAGDKHLHFGIPEPADTDQASIRALVTEKRRRLHELELRAARKGINTEPEITIEIKDLRAEIAQLAAVLNT